MVSRRPAGTAALLALLLSAGPSFATETVWDVLEGFGLTGVWSVACAAPTTAANFRYIYSRAANGGATRELDFGVSELTSSVIESAELLSPSTLKIRVRSTDPRFQHLNNLILETVLTKQIHAGTGEMRVRFIEAGDSSGKVYIKGGMVVGGAQVRVGKPTFWQHKCRPTMT